MLLTLGLPHSGFNLILLWLIMLKTTQSCCVAYFFHSFFLFQTFSCFFSDGEQHSLTSSWLWNSWSSYNHSTEAECKQKTTTDKHPQVTHWQLTVLLPDKPLINSTWCGWEMKVQGISFFFMLRTKKNQNKIKYDVNLILRTQLNWRAAVKSEAMCCSP